jgi:glycosyltransferase involved in cell wall biosynthesis
MQDNLPLVSIVVPVFNGEKYLRESLDSIVGQTYPRTQVLVMDDASADGTSAMVAAYGDRVTYYRQPKNKGQFGNVNDGIARADGEYIAVFHADDVYLPSIIEREVAFLQRYPEAGAVFCLDRFINAVGREYGRLNIAPEVQGGRPLQYRVILNALMKYKNRFLVGPSAMVRAAVYRDVGLYRGEEFRIASDLEMWVRIAQKYPLGILEEYLLSYRHGHGNSTQDYYHLRTEPERYFKIIDSLLKNGGRSLATAEALAEFEGHRAEDRLMLAVNHYIRAERQQSRAVLDNVQVRQVVASRQIQRGRLLLLLLLLEILVRLPRIPFLANQFYRRWYTRKYEMLR